MPLTAISPYLTYWRTTVALDREIVDGVVDDAHSAPSAELQDALDTWPGTYYWSSEKQPRRVVLIRALSEAPPERWWLHIALFALTFVTVWVAGWILDGAPGSLPVPRSASFADWWTDLADWFVVSLPGFGFAVALMAILLVHELGHYVMARRYHINASPPFFLPAPPQINFIGTFGAFIRLRSPVVDRRQLFDVGAAGPWAGAVVAVALLALGLQQSEIVTGVPGETRQLIYFGRIPFFLGDSLLMDAARLLIVGDHTVVLHPLALAGWFGLLVTMLNLLPLGQLDGGHIVFSLLGRHQAKIGVLMWYGLVLLGFKFGGWWIWAALILIIGRGRIAHPSVLDAFRPVPPSRWPLGVLTLVLFVVTFMMDPLPTLL